MSRETATTDAAVNGLVALALLSVGSAVASGAFAVLDTWLAAAPALLVWAVFGYVALKQVAHGIYTPVEDATSGA
jgi:hypothetical protein